MLDVSGQAVRGALAVLLCVLVGLLGCGGEPAPGVQTMQFNVDVDQLGAVVEMESLGVSYRPPRGWQRLAPSAIDSLEYAMDEDGNAEILRPIDAFVQTATGSMMSLATVHMDGTETFDEVAAAYRMMLEAQTVGDTLRQATFLKDGIKITQFLIQPPGFVNFKLLFEAPSRQVLQVDYVVPRMQYAGELRAIESSIGSIQLIQ